MRRVLMYPGRGVLHTPPKRSIYGTNNPENVMRFQIIRSLYPENVSRFAYSSSLNWYLVRRIHLASTFFSCLDTRKEGKRKSRPLPRPGKLAGYMMEIENVMRFAHSPSLGWRPV